jgi:arylsulfatase A-like enzyme
MNPWLEPSNKSHGVAFGARQFQRSAGISPFLRPFLVCPLLTAVVLTVLCVGTAEMLLMERKYGVFSAGFLQAHPLVTKGDRALFLFLSVWMDFAFFLPLALAWQWLLSRLGASRLLSAYYFLVIACSACLIVAALHYRLLSYFSDTINFAVVKQMAGNDMPTMLAYAADEMSVASCALVVAIIFYAVGLWIVCRLRPHGENIALPGLSRFPWQWKAAVAMLALALTVAAVYFVESSSRLHYSLRTKISYGALMRLFGAAGNDTAWLDHGKPSADVSLPRGPISYRRVGRAKNLIVVILESARGELIGKRIDGRLVAPNLTRLAAVGTSFAQAYAHASFTVPGKTALFSGSVAHVDPANCLFSILRRHGYQTSVFSSMDESFGDVDDVVGMEAGSSFFFDARQAKADRVFPFTAPGSLTLNDEHLFRIIANRLPAMDWRKPQFVYINFQAGHYPYYYPSMPRLLEEHPIPRGQIGPDHQEWVARTYWNALAFVDGLCGKLLAELQRLKVLDNTIVAFIGDHGESLYEDGTLGHGHALNEIQTRIPFVLNAPEAQADEPIGQAEAMSLLFRSVGLEQELPDRAPKIGPKAVFQYIGDLQQPVQIGLVEKNGRRLVLDFRTRQAFFSDLQESIPYDELNPELSARVERLVSEWRHHCGEERGWAYRRR